MLARLRAQPGADAIFRLVYLLRDTITNLTTQDEQVDCFRNVAGHLEPGGLFVIENYIPEPHADPVRVLTRTPAHLGFEEYDRAAQTAVSNHSGQGSWTSWPGSPAYPCAGGGAIGTAPRSPATGQATSPSG